MKLKVACLVVAASALACTAVYADYGVSNEGTWPESWPAELEPLRKQARTLTGPLFPNEHYAIHFTSREQFESAWPLVLKVKAEGAPIILARAPNFFLGKDHQAGLIVHAPPRGQTDNAATPPEPIRGKTDWRNTTYIELVVDGDIVDLNRIPLPADTPIIDKRFEEAKEK